MDNILDCKEKRVWYQEKLLKDHGNTLIVIKPNYPGAVKGNLYSNYTVYRITRDLKNSFDILNLSHTYTAEGLIFFVSVKNPAQDVKLECIKVENNHPLGRLVDMDVFDEKKSYSRRDFNVEARKCFLCEDDAAICVRSMKHSIDDVKKYFTCVVEDFILKGPIEDALSNIVSFSLLNELCRNHGYGCVTVNTTGSHQDMDFITFVESLDAISTSMKQITKIDYKDFQKLREFGIKVEKEMFIATKGINTHKGAVFIMLLILSGFLSTDSFGKMSEFISKLSQPLKDDFSPNVMKRSNGLEIFKEHQIKGVRESAMNGFTDLFHVLVPYYEKVTDMDDLSIFVLSQTDDTNVIHRSNLEDLNYLKETAGSMVEQKERYKLLSHWCIHKNISTGGSADLISSTLLLWMLKKHYKELKAKQKL